MAGDWIKVEEGMPDKPEVWAIAAALNIDPDAVAGKLIRVWVWASRSCHGDGVTNVTAKPAIDRVAGVTGFADSMIQVGWLAVDGQLMRFPNFDRHNSKTAKERGLAQIRQADRRSKAVTQTSRSDRDKIVTREEKRRVNTPLPPKGDGGDMRWIGKPQLEQPSAVLAWLSAYGPTIGLADVRDIRLRVLACAVRAVHPTAKDPAAVFKSLVLAGSGGDWSKIADEMEQAKRTLKGIENGHGERNGDTESATLGELARAVLGRTDAAGGG